MSERGRVKKQFRVNGIALRATVYRTSAGDWKIGSIGAVHMPTPLLPFEVQQVAMDLVRRPPFPTKEAAYGALAHPEA